MRYFLFVLTFFLTVSCAKSEKQEVKPSEAKQAPEKEFEMYAMSEMSLLMEQMYVDNQRLRERIVNGDSPGEFPKHFLNIHKASMTDESEKDDFFKEQAALYIKAQQLIYEDPNSAKEHFNAGVDACLSCHESKCGGPIPRIKKLYIK